MITTLYRIAAPILCMAILIAPLPVKAETLDSSDYRIEGATLNSTGGAIDGTDFLLISTIGEFSGDPRVNSTSYQLRTGSFETFIAQTPLLVCFETDTNGSSQCTSAPSYITSNGIVRACGESGCYNRARIEFDTQNNPDDTLYAIQISTDNFSTSLNYIDGVSLRPKPASEKSITDYRSESDWESTTLNIAGLDPSTQYWVRVVALHGDFTESDPSPSLSTTTTNSDIYFDIDIADQSQSVPETSSPYEIDFTGDYEIFQGGAPQTALNLVWLDIETNSNAGVAIVERGLYGGLFSSIHTYTISSEDNDLSSAAEGFGIQNYDYSGSSTYQSHHLGSGSGELGAITVSNSYNQSGHTVGEISTDFVKVYDGNAPIWAGRTGLRVKAKASSTTPVSTDYGEEITFVAVGRY